MKRTITIRDVKLTFEVPTTVQLALIDYALKQMVFDQLAGTRPLSYDPSVIRAAAKRVRGTKLMQNDPEPITKT